MDVMGDLPPVIRKNLYLVNIGLAAISIMLALGVIAFGWFEEKEVYAIISMAVAFYNTFIGILARQHVEE